MSARDLLRKTVVRRMARPDFPGTLNIEPTSLCNAHCVVCPVKRRPMGFMALDLYQRILDESLLYGRRMRLTLHKDGEPLLHPELPRMIAWAKEMRVAHHVTLNSNGVLLDRSLGREIIASGLDEIIFSLGAATAETYRRLKGLSNFEQTEQRIRDFLELRREMRSRTPRVRMMIIADSTITAGEVQAYTTRWSKLADGMRRDPLVNWAGGVAGETCGAPPSRRPARRHGCDYLWYTCAIQWDGKVARCVYDYDGEGAIGDLADHSLSEVWRGEPRQQLLRAQLRGDYCGPCERCDGWRKTVDLDRWFRVTARA